VSDLVRRDGRPPVPRVATSLAEAGPREVLHVDRRGQVRSPLRYRLRIAASFGALGSMAIGSAWLYYALIGPPGLLVGAGVAALASWLLSRWFRMRAGQRLFLAERFEEAEEQFSRVARARLVPRAVRAQAVHNIGSCRFLAGDFAAALDHYDRAIALYRKARARGLFPQMTRYARVLALTELDRLDEAEAELAAIGPVPEGDFLRARHYTSALYLALARGEHALGEEELYERARFALPVTGAAGLLGLLAWAYRAAGDEDMAWHLLREALDRYDSIIGRSMPRLKRWMDEHADTARNAADPEAPMF
jgi:tetratricopeptide (TPR) repeat protein